MKKSLLIGLLCLGIVFVLIFACTEQQNPFSDPNNVKITLVLKDSKDRIGKDFAVIDSVGNTVRIGIVSFLYNMIDSVSLSVLKYQNGKDSTIIIKNITSNTDTLWYEFPFKTAGAYSVPVKAYVKGAAPIFQNGTVTIYNKIVTATIRPAFDTVDVDSTVSFSVSALGDGPFSYQWFHGTTPITGKTDVSLFLTRAIVADSGNYYAIVLDKWGDTSITEPVRLVVTPKPVILQNNPPKWQLNPTTQVANQGQTITLDLSNKYSGDSVSLSLLSGIPSNDTLIGTVYSFTASATDTNSYTPKIGAKNAHGTDTLTINVTVKKSIDPVIVDTIAPTIKKISGPLTNAILKDSAITIVDSMYDASDIDSVYWILNDVRVASLTPDANKHYVISINLNKFHKNTIIVVASDKSKAKNKTVDTTIVEYAPPAKIITQPTNQSVVTGQVASFTVTAFGADLLYQWQKGNADIASAIAASYSITATTIADSGTAYRCIVSNSTGKDTSKPATLTVATQIIAPSITTQPANQNVVDGQPASFTVVASGTNPKYQWQKGTTDITNATSATYSITAAALTDSGTTYRCIVSNTAGKDTSNPASLLVASVKPQTFLVSASVSGSGGVIFPTGDIQVTKGKDTTFTFTSNAGFTIDSVLIDGVADAGAKTAKLYKFVNVTTAHTIRVRFAIKKFTIGATIVADVGTVIGAISQFPGGSLLDSNSSITLTAPTDADYTFNGWNGITGTNITTNPITFYLNGNKTVTANFTMKKYTLSVKILPTASGSVVQSPTASLYPVGTTVSLMATAAQYYSFVNWTVDANGTSTTTTVLMDGTKNITANFVRIALPIISTQPQSQTLYVGISTTFMVGASGSNTYQWKKNGNVITNAKGSTYTIPLPAPSDTGKYTVTITSGGGSIISDTAKFYPVFTVVAGGASNSLFLKTDGVLWSCGSNGNGQLGSGSDNQSTPIQVMPDVQGMAAGYGGDNSLIVKKDGSLWTCGDNFYGQLGDGTTTNRYSTLETFVSNVQKVVAGQNFSLILKKDGTLWACGSNSFGQLGDSTTSDRSRPVLVMTDVKSMAAGSLHSLILKTDGTLFGCGFNGVGQLGDSTTTDRSIPVRIATGVQSVAGGGMFSMILKQDGTLWGAGFNAQGQLGDGTKINRSTFVQTTSDVEGVTVGLDHTLILKTDATIWSCGSNSNGQLGDGSTTNNEKPKPVPSLTNVKFMAAGNNHSLVIKKDGSLWVFGSNDIGQLGNGTMTDRLTPIQIKF